MRARPNVRSLCSGAHGVMEIIHSHNSHVFLIRNGDSHQTNFRISCNFFRVGFFRPVCVCVSGICVDSSFPFIQPTSRVRMHYHFFSLCFSFALYPVWVCVSLPGLWRWRMACEVRNLTRMIFLINLLRTELQLDVTLSWRAKDLVRWARLHTAHLPPVCDGDKNCDPNENRKWYTIIIST